MLSPTYAGGDTQMKASVDREWMRVSEAKTYFVVALDPDAPDFCVEVRLQRDPTCI